MEQLIGLVGIIIILGMVYLLYKVFDNLIMTNHNMITYIATIISCKKKDNKYKIKVKYNVNDTEYINTLNSEIKLKGKEITILYDKLNPNKIKFYHSDSNIGPLIGFVYSPLLCICMIISLLFIYAIFDYIT